MTKIDNVNNDALTVSVDMDVVKNQTSRTFDASSISWSENSEHNRVFLRAQQAYANDQLNYRGFLLLNDVYESLGFARTAVGAVVGWRKKPEGYITFGLDALQDGPFRLEFNVDGPILDLL